MHSSLESLSVSFCRSESLDTLASSVSFDVQNINTSFMHLSMLVPGGRGRQGFDKSACQIPLPGAES